MTTNVTKKVRTETSVKWENDWGAPITLGNLQDFVQSATDAGVPLRTQITGNEGRALRVLRVSVVIEK